MCIIHAVISIAISIQIVIRVDEVKLLCYLILIVAQSIIIMAFALLFFPGKWISHRVKDDMEKKRVKLKFGSAH